MRGRAVLALTVLLAGCGAEPGPTGSQPTSPSAAPSERPSQSPPTSQVAEPSTAPPPAAWERIDTAGPAAREDHTWTVAVPGRLAILFGGRDGATVFDDLWAYDLDTDAWTELAPAPGPAARFGHEAVWVDDLGLVVFAGQAGAAFFNDLWAYDPDRNAWTELPSRGDVPVPRYGTCSAIGPDERLWISHGFTSDGARFQDTRAYDFETGTWTDETPDGALPVERCLHACWWTVDGAFVLYGGQTTGTLALDDRWALEDGGWTSSGGNPTARNLYAQGRSESADDGATLIFGGQALDGSYLRDTWLVADDDRAIEVTVEGELPSERAGAAMVIDSGAGRVLIFGGRNGAGSLADVWSLSGTFTAARLGS